MRVAHVIAAYREGMGYEENHLPFVQACLGAEVHLITSTLLSGSWRSGIVGDVYRDYESAGTSNSRGVQIHRLPCGLRARQNSQITLRGLKRTLKSLRPDIIHIHGPTGALSVQAAVAARSLDIPAVVDNHLCYFNLHPYGAVKRAYYRLFRHVMLPALGSAVQVYMPLMPDSEAVLHNELGIPLERMAHSTLGVDTDDFRCDSSARVRIRQKHAIPLDAPVVAFAGRITPVKEIDVLVSAWQATVSKHGTHLVLIGPAADAIRQELVEMFDHRFREMVTITGHVANADLPDYLSAADIGVWPGDPGISTIQAVSCGLPIVCAEANYMAGVPTSGNGRLFPRGDVEALAETLGEMLKNWDQLCAMRSISQQLAADMYDWRVVARRTNQIYDEVVTGTPSSLPPLWNPVPRAARIA